MAFVKVLAFSGLRANTSGKKSGEYGSLSDSLGRSTTLWAGNVRIPEGSLDERDSHDLDNLPFAVSWRLANGRSEEFHCLDSNRSSRLLFTYELPPMQFLFETHILWLAQRLLASVYMR